LLDFDIIHDNFSGLVANGDTIIFKEVGAYSLVMKPPFILPDVAIIQFNQAKNSFDLIREKQTFNHVFQNFIF
jgi:diaminopimelate decarboxylase